MTYGVVIPSGSEDNLGRAVAALLAHQPGFPPDRIVVVADRLPDAARRRVPEGTRWLCGPSPFVFSRNVNLGARACGDLDVVLMADDVELETRLGFDALARVGRDDPEIGLVAAGVDGPCGKEEQRHDPSTPLRFEQDWLSFVCVLIPRRTWRAVGPMDEQFDGYGFDDVDYSWRVARSGMRLAISNECVVRHDAGTRSVYRSRPMEEHFAASAHNEALFRTKWQLPSPSTNRGEGE